MAPALPTQSSSALEPTHRRLFALGAAGAAVFALGLLAAAVRLPEWRGVGLAAASTYTERVLSALPEAGLTRSDAPPKVSLASQVEAPGESPMDRRDAAYRELDTPQAADWLAAQGRGPYVVVRVDASRAGAAPAGARGLLRVVLARDATPVAASWIPRDALRSATGPGELATIGRSLAALLSGSSPGADERGFDRLGSQFGVRAVRGTTHPPETVFWMSVGANGVVLSHRRPGATDKVIARLEESSVLDMVMPELARLLSQLVLCLVVGGSLFRLVHQRRLGMVNALLLGTLTVLFALPWALAEVEGALDLISQLLGTVLGAAALAALWAVAESWTRLSVPGFTTSLDTLRLGRLGPRAGRALLAGAACGATFAGLWLAAAALAATVPALAPAGSSSPLPVFGATRGPLHSGLLWAGVVLLLLGFAERLAPRRARSLAVTAGAVGASALFLAPFVPVRPLPAALAVAVALAALLTAAYRRFGLAALLVAAAMGFLLPSAAAAWWYRPWSPGALVASVALAAAPLVAGAVGLARPARDERGAGPVSAFVRQLEQEHRLRHEMDLLTRMQLGLLPASPPPLRGWRIAARSLLASEAGGDLYDFVTDADGSFWLAAGDVAGHGYSCAITGAMTKAGLAALIEPGRGPAEVLERLDRVLRRAASNGPRAFTSLCLARLDPATGELRLANAGHPFPFLLGADRSVRELVLPGLPLGQGPERRRDEMVVTIPPGGAVVVASDGLFEGVDADDEAYGFERAGAAIAAAAWRADPGSLLEALLADWRQHVGDAPLADDTTLVVLRRELDVG